MLAKELSEMAQRRRTYVMRVVFALLLFSFSALISLPLYRAAQESQFGLMGQGGQFLSVLYEVEWFGLCLFVPALVSGTLAAEKERNTLELLFLTRLGPWTILLEKLFARLVPVATFLLVSLPLVFVAYLLGGLQPDDLQFAVLGLVATAFQVGCLGLFCSAFCATSAGALILSYLLLAFVFLLPVMVVIVLRVADSYGLVPFAHQALTYYTPPWAQFWINSTQGMTGWMFRPFRSPLDRSFHTTFAHLLVIGGIGLFFLVLARLVVVRRGAPRSKHRLRQFFGWLDRIFQRLNDRFARGIVVSRQGGEHDLPADNPVAWREKRRGNLGRLNYLIRIMLVTQAPIIALIVVAAAVTTGGDVEGLHGLCFLLWPIALLVVLVRASGLVAAEKDRQTLDVLLTSPLTLAGLAGAKIGSLRRIMLIVSVPLVFHALLAGYVEAAVGKSLYTMLSFGSATERWGGLLYEFLPAGAPSWNGTLYVVLAIAILVILLNLAAQLSFRFGLRARSQGRAIVATLALFVAWCFLPLLVRFFADLGPALYYASPIGGLLLNEIPRWGVEHFGRGGQAWHGTGIAVVQHCVLYGLLVFALARTNRRMAARVLLRATERRPGG